MVGGPHRPWTSLPKLRDVLHPILAADLVPWWFALAFWVALAALVAFVIRDVQRLGGPRRVVGALRRAISEWLDDDEVDPRTGHGSDHQS